MIFLINTCNKSHFTDIIVYAICAVYFEIFTFLLKLPNCDNFIRVTKILIFNKKKNPIVILYAIKIFCTMKHIADLFFFTERGNTNILKSKPVKNQLDD